MPNIAIHYTDKTFDDTEIECIAPMPVSGDSMTCNSATVTEPEVTQVKLKRCSLWLVEAGEEIRGRSDAPFVALHDLLICSTAVV